MKNMKKLLMTAMMLILAFSFSSVVSAAPQCDKVRTYYEDIGKNGKVVQEEGVQRGYALPIYLVYRSRTPQTGIGKDQF